MTIVRRGYTPANQRSTRATDPGGFALAPANFVSLLCANSTNVRCRQADLSMLRRSHDHHRGLRARCNATASADSSTHRNQGRHLMTASHLRKSDRRTSCLSTGHGRARSDTQPSSQTVRQFTAIDATRRSSSSRFTVHRLAGAPRLHSHTSSAALKSP